MARVTVSQGQGLARPAHSSSFGLTISSETARDELQGSKTESPTDLLMREPLEFLKKFPNYNPDVPGLDVAIFTLMQKLGENVAGRGALLRDLPETKKLLASLPSDSLAFHVRSIVGNYRSDSDGFLEQLYRSPKGTDKSPFGSENTARYLFQDYSQIHGLLGEVPPKWFMDHLRSAGEANPYSAFRELSFLPENHPVLVEVGKGALRRLNQDERRDPEIGINWMEQLYRFCGSAAVPFIERVARQKPDEAIHRHSALLRRISEAGQSEQITHFLRCVDDSTINFTTRRSLYAIFPLLAANPKDNQLRFDDAVKKLERMETGLPLLLDYYRSVTDIDPSQLRYALRLMSEEYIEPFNNRHDISDPKVRFREAGRLTPDQLTSLLSFAHDELYTSTFLGIVEKLLLPKLAPNTPNVLSGDELLGRLSEPEFRNFVADCSFYGRLDALFGTVLDKDKVLKRFFAGLDVRDPTSAQLMLATQVLLSPLPLEQRSSIEKTLVERYTNPTSDEEKRFYGLILGKLSLQDLLQDGSFGKELENYRSHWPDHAKLPVSLLRDHDGVVRIRLHFPGDKDGLASLGHFRNTFPIGAGWKTVEKENYLVISKKVGKQEIAFYANKPGADISNLDLDPGTQELNSLLEGKYVSTTVLRGHKFNISQMISQISGDEQFVFGGGCGGSTQLEALLEEFRHTKEKGRNTHVLTTRGTGTMIINDEVLKAFANEIFSGVDEVGWASVQQRIPLTVRQDPRYSDYLFPDKSLSQAIVAMMRARNRKD
jgi:hypothetical protein